MTQTRGTGTSDIPRQQSASRPHSPHVDRPGPTLADLYAARFSDELALPPVLPLADGDVRLVARPRHVRLHRDLPPTPMWCYVAHHRGRTLVNPTLEVESGAAARVEYVNALGSSTLPVRFSEVHGTDETTDGVVVVSNYPGLAARCPTSSPRRGSARTTGRCLRATTCPACSSRTCTAATLRRAPTAGWKA